MKKKDLEELKVLADKAKKSLEEDLKSNREQQEHLRRVLLMLEALKELLEENDDFRKLYESKFAELIHKEKATKEDQEGTGD